MMSLGSALREQCLKISSAALEGEKWVARQDDLGPGVDNLRRKLRRSARMLQNYAGAAEGKMGLAIFGPSQAGKSTLISALAKGRAGSLKARFGDDDLDFLTQINPEGGNETTGLVTRFSLDSAPAVPHQNHPVCLKLFSEMDLVKILANTYFGEAKGARNYTEEELEESLAELSRRPAGGSRVTLDELEDLREYLNGLSVSTAAGVLLNNNYWERALVLGQSLDLDGRARLFSYLWGRVEEFTKVYLKLYQAIEKLGFSELAFCELAALYTAADGRQKSVLHVDRLLGLLNDNAERVSVCNPAGRAIELTRPVLSAIIAEVHIQVQEKPGDFMDNADILDFPGYRARSKLENINLDLKEPETLKTCFLRGKVAYLFERYAARKEITAILLCVAESVQNNPDLPGVIDKWIKETHGETPADRTGKPVSLFLILTKFDRLLEKGAGSTDTQTRWENRYNASFLQFFGNYQWPKEWSLKNGQPQPFQNIFWLLNLDYGADIFEFDQGRPVGVKASQRSWLASLYQGYLAAPPTRIFISDPQAAWEAILETDDGGAGYILKKLAEVCNPDIKRRQLACLAQLETATVWSILKEHYQGGDQDEQRQVKTELARKILTLIKALAQDKRCFGEFLRLLQLSDDECYSLYGAKPTTDGPAPGPERPAGPAAAEVDIFDELFGGPTETAQAQPKPSPLPANVSDAASDFRRRIERAWLARLDEASLEPRWQRYFSFPRELFTALASELEQGARRLGIMDDLEVQLRESLSYGNINPEKMIWKQARQAAAHLSDYVNWLGLSPRRLSAAERTVTLMGRACLLFEPPPPPNGYPELPDEPPCFDQPYYQDWSRALLRLILNNVDFSDKRYNMEENMKLGAILKTIQNSRAAGLELESGPAAARN